MNPTSLAWFNSVSGQFPAHFLETCPKSPTLTFTNKEFVQRFSSFYGAGAASEIEKHLVK